MTESTEKTTSEDFQQQILFEEDIKLKVEADELTTEQIFVENNDWQPLEIEQDVALIEEEASAPKGANWLLRTLIGLIFTLTGIELFEFFTLGFTESPITTGLYGVVLLCVVLLSGSAFIREFTGLRQLKQREKLKSELEIAKGKSSSKELLALCDSYSEQLTCDLDDGMLAKWQQAKAEQYSNEELSALYSRLVLKQVDEKAMAEVAKFSSESVVLVALSPLALLDMLITFWRNLKMVDKIAGLYGLKLGYWSRVKLVKQVFINMIYAGASEVVADVSVDMLGADLLGKLSGRLAQGLGAGMLTARLGLRTIYMCRPVPVDEQTPKLSDVRREVIQQIKQLMPKG